jgi:tetratricopeptide (TPR) repeat protein
MPARFDLIITADYPNRTAEFTLRDSAGVQLAFRQTDFKTIAVSHQHGLFDLRNYLRLYVEEGKELAAVAEIGVCIAEEVLGEEIFAKLWASQSERTLRIQLPGAGDEDNLFAAALARVPWEIARPSADRETLGERNLLVRVVHDMQAPASTPIALAADEPLRVLFVFAEARGSRPLGARQERRELLRLFEKEIYPQRRIIAHFLTHGVTRERLESQIQVHGGYHVVHWSGHGGMNVLELCQPGGKSDHLSGQQLLDLFHAAGGFLPRLFFLSACHSGDILRVKDWNDFLAVARGRERGTKKAEAAASAPGRSRGNEAQTSEMSETPHVVSYSSEGAAETKDLDLKEQPGYTGTAHALLQGGVPSVVAMRYAVGDDYAREAAVEFYRALLAHPLPKNVAAALTMARQAMLDGNKHDPARFDVCDHATPVLYGEEQPGLTLVKGRSPALNPRNPRLHPIAELTTAGHEHFVGRTWELVGLGANFIGSSTGAEVQPVAVITGLGGMGKTALTAEALALWETRFEWVLLYQAKPNALGFEATLRDIHIKLMGELKLYHDHVRANPADAIYRDATAEFTGPARLERLTRNLLRALKDEPILLVLDNFETNLKPSPRSSRREEAQNSKSEIRPAATARQRGENPKSEIDQSLLTSAATWDCQDPAWDDCLALLARELIGSPSRLLITCRRPLAALAGGAAHSVLLGPLPGAEAALYLKEQPTLSHMVFGNDAAEKALAYRLFDASRFHPLLMDRLAKLAAHEPTRTQLLAALEALEKTKDFAQLPALFATAPGDAKELAYLEDALITSHDLLIHDSRPDARRLLWIIATANQPERLGLVKGVWSGESHEQSTLRAMKRDLGRLHELPPDHRAYLKNLPPKLRAMLDALPPEGPAKPDLAPLLAQLVSVGLVSEERDEPDDANPNLTCHELVRERIRAWMERHAQDRAELTENAIRLAYAERLAATYDALQHQSMTAALQAGSRALVYCVQAGARERLGGFAGRLVTSTSDPRLLEALVPHLLTAAESAPEGEPRWRCFGNLADALRLGGQSNASLPFYEHAAALARAAAEAGREGARQAWADLATTTGNWANALLDAGYPDTARQLHLDSAETKKKVGRPAIHVVGSELEALRIDIMQGKVATALPEVEARLAKVEAWWQQHRSRKPVPEAPDAEFLARVFISALDIATDAHFAQQDCASALRRIDAILEVKRALARPAEDIAVERMNRANVLGQLDRFGEAEAELEDCLQLFQDNPAMSAKVRSSFASLFNARGDDVQAIIQERRSLALCEQLPNPSDRAGSHHNLASYLERIGTPSALAESPRHELAALVYRLVAGLGQGLKMSQHNYAIAFRRAHAAGTVLDVPRVTALLADPAFAPLEQWLRQRQVPLDQLQATVDQFLDQARQAALSQS